MPDKKSIPSIEGLQALLMNSGEDFLRKLLEKMLNFTMELEVEPGPEKKASGKDHDDDDDEPGNGGTMIIDATRAPSNIKYPQDMTLLNEARECAEKIIDALHAPGEAKPRTYREKARGDYLKFARKRNRSRTFMRKSIKKQLGYLSRDLAHIDAMLTGGRALDAKLHARLETIRNLVQASSHTAFRAGARAAEKG